jgi:hypothetical protein
MSLVQCPSDKFSSGLGLVPVYRFKFSEEEPSGEGTRLYEVAQKSITYNNLSYQGNVQSHTRYSSFCEFTK